MIYMLHGHNDVKLSIKGTLMDSLAEIGDKWKGRKKSGLFYKFMSGVEAYKYGTYVGLPPQFSL